MECCLLRPMWALTFVGSFSRMFLGLLMALFLAPIGRPNGLLPLLPRILVTSFGGYFLAVFLVVRKLRTLTGDLGACLLGDR